MGCAASNLQPEAGGKEEPKGGSQNQNMRLLEVYAVGHRLGEGAFGVVSKCRKRSTGEEFAVKVMSIVDTPLDAIRKEADMLQNLDHPNIVKIRNVYYEPHIVGIVMDIYCGHLVEGLHRHLRERGEVFCHRIIHLSRQMGESIAYLHSRHVVHRDIKGDNFLMDRRDMTDPECKIVLTDFGTACKIEPEQRLRDLVGTKMFWAPEFFDKDYGSKVDVWAMGVTLCGIVNGHWPFKDENDIRTREVKIPEHINPLCEDFIKKMLDKVESSRPQSSAVIKHKWLTGRTSQQPPEHTKEEEDDDNLIYRQIMSC